MYNWSIDTIALKKNSKKYAIWKLEQLINYGLDGEKLSIKLLKKYWNNLHIDLKRRKVLTLWLWGKQS